MAQVSDTLALLGGGWSGNIYLLRVDTPQIVSNIQSGIKNIYSIIKTERMHEYACAGWGGIIFVTVTGENINKSDEQYNYSDNLIGGLSVPLANTLLACNYSTEEII